MKYFAATSALISVVPGIVALTINTPSSVVQCQPQLLSWTDGIPPYYLSIIPGGQPAAAPLKTFDTTSSTSQTWVVDIASGTSVTCVIKDSTGAISYTDIVPIQKGNGDSSCMNGGTPNPDPAAAVDTTNGGNTSGNGGNSAAASVATQAADASASATSSTSVAASSGISRTTVGIAAGTTGRATSSIAAGAAAATQSRAVSSTSAATASASRAATTGTSGAVPGFTGTGFGLAGFVALVGAMFL